MRKKVESQVEDLLLRYEVESTHVRQVKRLADNLFTGLRPWHRLGAEAQELLAVAALLHDLGWSQSPTGARHHKISARMIRAVSWDGFDAREVGLIAEIARYHRRALPSLRHRTYRNFSPADQRHISILAGVLRVADALDRTHSSVVDRIDVILKPSQVRLLLHTRSPCPAEISTAKEKGDLLELVMGRRLRFRAAESGKGKEVLAVGG